jgi:hypothetical protein
MAKHKKKMKEEKGEGRQTGSVSWWCYCGWWLCSGFSSKRSGNALKAAWPMFLLFFSL